jgi:predicted RNA-binding Zn-ribbon protein involved in translation (DUF1610 family)
MHIGRQKITRCKECKSTNVEFVDKISTIDGTHKRIMRCLNESCKREVTVQETTRNYDNPSYSVILSNPDNTLNIYDDI